MESLFNSKDYRSYLTAKLRTYPKNGHGIMGKLAAAIGVHPSLVSQILKGEKGLTLDQAMATAGFLALSEIETDYFLLLVQIDRAGTKQLKVYLDQKLSALKEKSSHLVNRLKAEEVLAEEAKGIFYSDWRYSAVRQMTAIPGLETIEAIAHATGLTPKEIRGILDFLVENRLCVLADGKYSIGSQSTHLPDTSPWVGVHHRNWRQLAVEKMGPADAEALFFTCPLTIAAHDRKRVRELIVKFIDDVYKVVDPSPSEKLCCLNIDWFKVIK